MPRPFSTGTAEQVVAAVEAVYVARNPTEPRFVAEFADLPLNKAESALKLAVDIGFLLSTSGTYTIGNLLCRFISVPNLTQKTAVLRVILESYPPFIIFRERLIATDDPIAAARQVKAALDLDEHHEAIKDTLISLGTYSQALKTEGGGRYSPAQPTFENTLTLLAQACGDLAAAELFIRNKIGRGIEDCSPSDVIEPLADAILRAARNDARGAVVAAGNAVESYLVGRADRMTVDLTGATGLNAKIEKFDQASLGANRLPKKLVFFGKYLGHIRNAADHGTDSDVGAAWDIAENTGLEYVNVACSFIAALSVNERHESPLL